MPMAGTQYMRVIDLPWEANLDIALLTGTGSYSPQAPAVDKDPIKPSDSSVQWNPRKYSVHVAIAEEMLIGGGYTNFRERLLEWLAVKVMAPSLNVDQTKGAGGSGKTNVVEGVLTGLTGGNVITTASGTDVTAAEVRSVLLKYVNAYGAAAGAYVQMTPTFENHLAQKGQDWRARRVSVRAGSHLVGLRSPGRMEQRDVGHPQCGGS